MSSRVKNSAIQVSSPATLMSVLKAGGCHSQLVGTGTPLLATLSGRVFADTQDASMYKEFMNADKEM